MLLFLHLIPLSFYGKIFNNVVFMFSSGFLFLCLIIVSLGLFYSFKGFWPSPPSCIYFSFFNNIYWIGGRRWENQSDPNLIGCIFLSLMSNLSLGLSKKIICNICSIGSWLSFLYSIILFPCLKYMLEIIEL